MQTQHAYLLKYLIGIKVEKIIKLLQEVKVANDRIQIL